MIVKLRAREEQYPDLSPEQAYVVIGIEADDFRLLNDQGRPYLYAHECFESIDPRQPDDRITEIGEDGERYAYPPALSKLVSLKISLLPNSSLSLLSGMLLINTWR